MIEITLQNVGYGFFDNPDAEEGRIVGFRDEESGIIVKVPFNGESWKAFLAGASGREIVIPSDIESIKAAAAKIAEARGV